MTTAQPQMENIFLRIQLEVNGGAIGELAHVLEVIEGTTRKFQYQEAQMLLARMPGLSGAVREHILTAVEGN